VYNSITEATIQYVPLVDKVAMDSDTIEQYKKLLATSIHKWKN